MTSTDYFSNSTGSSVTNRRFFPDIDERSDIREVGMTEFKVYRCPDYCYIGIRYVYNISH